MHGTKVIGLKNKEEMLSPLEAARNSHKVFTGHKACCSLELFLKALIKIGPRLKDDNSFFAKNWGLDITDPLIVFSKHYEPFPPKQRVKFANPSAWSQSQQK